jgi:hypothetical protein
LSFYVPGSAARWPYPLVRRLRIWRGGSQATYIQISLNRHMETIPAARPRRSKRGVPSESKHLRSEKSKRQTRQHPQSSLSTEPAEDYPSITDPVKADRPVEDIVHESLSFGWKVNTRNQMWFIFDSVNPARQFKQGMRHDDSIDFPAPSLSFRDVTEIDESPPLMQFAPREYK